MGLGAACRLYIMRGMKRITVLAFFGLLAGCTGAPAPGVTSRAIINGTADTGDPAVIMVVSQVPGSMQASLCTGEVISPHVVLTAAHCVDPATVGQGAKTYVYTQPVFDFTKAPPPGTLFAASDVHYDLSFDPQHPENAHDIGVVIMGAPLAITPIPYNRKPITADLFGQPARLIGYGITSATDTMSAGTKREAPSVMIGLDKNNTSLVDYQDGMHGICEGDSGGPGLMMIDGQERIVSVTSFGYQGCPTSQPGAETRVDLYTPFVDMYVTQNDPPAVQEGDPCTSDTDCAPLSCASTSTGKVCTTPCDPTLTTDTCGNGTKCTAIDGQNLCIKPMEMKKSGCSMSGNGAPASGAALLLVAAALLVSRRRRV